MTNYVVEKKDVMSDRWAPVGKFVHNTRVDVMELLDGHSYNFRVMAENEYGIGQPLELSSTVTAQYPYSELSSHCGACMLTNMCSSLLVHLVDHFANFHCNRNEL